VLARKRRQHILATPLGNKNQAMMADLSNPSNPTSSEKLLEEYSREYDRAVEGLLLSCFRITEQRVVKIKELQPPSKIDVLMEMQSSGTLSDVLSDFVKHLIHKEDSSIPTPVIQESAIEKPTSDPCKILPIVAGQVEIRPSQAEFVDPKFPKKSTETIFSSSTLGGQQNKGKGAGCTTTGLTDSPIGQTASSRVSPNNSKPKMVKPKKPEIGVWKTIEAKGRKKHQKEKPKLIHGELPAKTKMQINVNDASRSKNFKQPKFAPKQKFRKQNRQWSNPHIFMPFPSYGAPLHVPWEFYFNMHYPYPPWSYNSYMPFPPRYFCSDYITYKESAIKKSPLANNDRFIHKNRSVQKKKRKVTKQVYRVKKRWPIN